MNLTIITAQVLKIKEISLNEIHLTLLTPNTKTESTYITIIGRVYDKYAQHIQQLLTIKDYAIIQGSIIITQHGKNQMLGMNILDCQLILN